MGVGTHGRDHGGECCASTSCVATASLSLKDNSSLWGAHLEVSVQTRDMMKLVVRIGCCLVHLCLIERVTSQDTWGTLEMCARRQVRVDSSRY